MIFLILFIVGGLILPVSIDATRHKGDNIFKRSSRDLVKYELPRSVLRALRVSVTGASSAISAAVGVALIPFTLWLLVKLLRLIF
jgi:hypothetical protein